jgi:peptidoglycan/xylan/chitin deacetylase (PgdA/CDA1 family)
LLNDGRSCAAFRCNALALIAPYKPRTNHAGTATNRNANDNDKDTIPVSTRLQHAPLVRFSIALHAALALGLALAPAAWPWLLAAFVADHALLTCAGLWPRSALLGPNWTALPAACAARGQIALTIDDGPDPEVTPAVLDLLERHGAKATFFCIGERARRHPQLCRDIIARGHALENHSQHHRHNFSLLGPRAYARELQAAQDTLFEITGRRPRFFRAPAGLRNPFLDAQLKRFGLQLAAWTRRGFDTRSGDALVVLRRLLPGLRAGAILLLHDGNCARSASGEPVILALLPELLQRAHAAQLSFVTLPEALQTASKDLQP